MSRVFNFSAGPATLPESVLRQAQEEMLEWGSSGASIVEHSHRGAEFIEVATKAEADRTANIIALITTRSIACIDTATSSPQQARHHRHHHHQ